MTTHSGKEEKLVDALIHLMALDFDTISAYETAIERLNSSEIKRALQKFLLDHWRHTRELGPLIDELGGQPPASGDLKSLVTTGRVLLGQLASDAGILSAMRANESDVNLAYEQAAGRADLPGRVRNIICRGLQDERRHSLWLEDRLAALNSAMPTPKLFSFGAEALQAPLQAR